MTRFLDLADPAFDVTSAAVHDARDERWYAETPYGHAVLRHAEASALLTDRRFRQGNARWPEQNGIHEGPFLQWWQEVLLSLEGDDHARLRRLLMRPSRWCTSARWKARSGTGPHSNCRRAPTS